MMNFVKAGLFAAATLTAALPASAYTSYFGGGAATTERVFRDYGSQVWSGAQNFGSQVRSGAQSAYNSNQAAANWGAQKALEFGAKNAGKALGLGRNAGWLGIGVQLAWPEVAH